MISDHYHLPATLSGQWRLANQQVVLVTGVFDVLHIEHFRFLNKAKAAGDRLIVGIDSDHVVRQTKGPHRPINPQHIRSEQLTYLKAVDHIHILPEQFNKQADWEMCIQQINPHIYAVSSHTAYLENKRAIAQKFGVQFQIVHHHNPDFSTSKYAQHIAAEL